MTQRLTASQRICLFVCHYSVSQSVSLLLVLSLFCQLISLIWVETLVFKGVIVSLERTPRVFTRLNLADSLFLDCSHTSDTRRHTSTTCWNKSSWHETDFQPWRMLWVIRNIWDGPVEYTYVCICETLRDNIMENKQHHLINIPTEKLCINYTHTHTQAHAVCWHR